MVLVWLLAAGCTSTPSISSVAPTEVAPGDRLEVFGEAFGEEMLVYLTTEGREAVVLDGIEVLRPRLLAGSVPGGLTPGTYDVVIDHRGHRIALDAGLQILPPLDERACSEDYTANTELSLVRKEIVIDRYFRDGERDTVRLPLDEVDRLEYEVVDLDAGRCSVIYLRTTEGRRIVFDDDPVVDLEDRAQTLARDMGKPVTVTRPDDGAAMGE